MPLQDWQNSEWNWKLSIEGSEGTEQIKKSQEFFSVPNWVYGFNPFRNDPRSQFHSISTSYRACWTENEMIVKRLNQVMAAP